MKSMTGLLMIVGLTALPQLAVAQGAAISAHMPQFPISAAGADQQSPSVLTQVTLISENATESKIRFNFSPAVNRYTSTTDPSGKPALRFANTTRGSSAEMPPGSKGIVRDLIFDQLDNVLIVRFAVSQPVTVVTTAATNAMVEVLISASRFGALELSNHEISNIPLTTPAILPQEVNAELYMLKYADVSEVVGLLSDGATVTSNDFFFPKEPGFGSNSLAGGGNYNSGQAALADGGEGKPLGQSVDSSIAIDRRLNAIWLKGSMDHIAHLKTLIQQIDVPLDSVVLETELVELSESGARSIGLDFTNANGQTAVGTFQTGQYLTSGQANSGHLSGTQLQAALYLQIQKGQGKIVSKPKISAQSGSTAKIITGDALPILTSITLSGVNGVSQQVQYVNVGVTLQIAPRVSSDGFVSTHVFCVVSTVTGYSQGFPTISQREAETSATVHDGDTFIIGGLVQDQRLTSSSAVPVLGSIPLLGQAFRHDSRTTSRTELYIVITPHIVHHSAYVSNGPSGKAF